MMRAVPDPQQVCDYLNQFLLAAQREPVTPDHISLRDLDRVDVRLTIYQYVPLMQALRERFGAPIAHEPTLRYLKREWKITETQSIVVAKSIGETPVRYTVHLIDSESL